MASRLFLSAPLFPLWNLECYRKVRSFERGCFPKACIILTASYRIYLLELYRTRIDQDDTLRSLVGDICLDALYQDIAHRRHP